MDIFDWLNRATEWIAEVIGIIAMLGTIAFWVRYQRTAHWRLTAPGRSVMYLARSLTLTFVLLILWSFIPEPREIRWIAEVMVYSPLAWACWNLYFTLRKAQGQERFVFLVPRKRPAASKTAGKQQQQKE